MGSLEKTICSRKFADALLGLPGPIFYINVTNISHEQCLKTKIYMTHDKKNGFEGYSTLPVQILLPQLAFTCSKLTKETLEQDVKYVQS